MYDKIMETTDSSSAIQNIQMLVKYSRSMKDLLKEIQKLLLPRGTPRRMIDLGMSGSPTTTLYKVIGKVEPQPPRPSPGLAKPQEHRRNRNSAEFQNVRRLQFRKGRGRL